VGNSIGFTDMARPTRPRPNAFGENWPDFPCLDPVAETARLFVVNLIVAIDGRSLRTVSDLTAVDHSALSRILNGDTWPDLSTIARLEHGLGTAIYPQFRSTN